MAQTARERQTKRLLASPSLPKSYPVGAKKAFARMQGFYGASNGRRIFIQKAQEQGKGTTLRQQIASVYGKGAKQSK